jgi:hypothetical protein
MATAQGEAPTFQVLTSPSPQQQRAFDLIEIIAK